MTLADYSHDLEEGIEMITGTLSYNSQYDRYGLLVSDLWEIEGFHCGQSLELLKNGQGIPTRVEMHYQAPTFPKKRNNGWYLFGTEYSGTALEGLTVRVNS